MRGGGERGGGEKGESGWERMWCESEDVKYE